MAAQPASLRRGALFVLLGNGVFNACRLAALIWLAKTTSPEIVGQFETGMAIATPVVLFFALELRAVLVADSRTAPPLSEYRRFRRVGLSMAGVVLAGVAAWSFRTQPVALAAVLAGAMALRWMLQAAELDWGVYQRIERLDWLGLPNALRGVAMLACFVAILPWPGLDPAVSGIAQRAAIAIGTAVAAWVLVSLLFDGPRVGKTRSIQPNSSLAVSENRGNEREKRSRPDPDAELPAQGHLVWDALPLTLVALLIALCESLPRLVVRGQDQGLTALGHFGAIAYLPMAAHFVTLQLGLAASRRLAVTFREDWIQFRGLVGRLTLIALGLGVVVLIVVFFVGDRLLSAAFRPDYAAHAQAFVILTLAQCVLLLASIWGYVLTQMRRFWSQVPIHIAVTAISACAALILIPPSPVLGAAETMLIRSIVHAAAYGLLLAFSLRNGKQRLIA